MFLNLKKDFLNSLITNYKNDLSSYYTYQGFLDSEQDFGIEHYKLFMGISRQLNNVKILEIGTHNGNSAVALSYGKLYNNNITIDTYDIINLLQKNPKIFFDKYNVNYHLENLFDNNLRELYKNNILSYDIIFIDIDPHEGILEYEMLLWLKDNNYKGLIIFDDIHLGLNHTANNYRPTQHSMIEFWEKIEENFKKDLTFIGHHSGTGLVSFNFNEHEIIID
jgi:predicted O-methyltransferase YrrM